MSDPPVHHEKRSNPKKAPDLPGDLFLQVVKNLSSYARVLNGVVISDGLKNGSINKAALAHEFLNTNPELTLESLKKMKVAEIAKDISALASKVSAGCAQNEKPCDGLKEISNHITSLETVGQKVGNVSEVFKERSASQLLVVIKTTDKETSEIIREVDQLNKVVEEVQKTVIDDSKKAFKKAAPIFTSLERIVNSKNTFSKQFTPQELELFVNANLVAHLNIMSQLGTISSDIQKMNFQPIKAKLASLKKLASEAKPHLTGNTYNEIQKRLKMLTAISDLPLERINLKSYTHAFFMGFKDLSRLFLDVESPFIKNAVMKGANPKLLKKIIAPLASFEKEIEPVYNSLHSGNAKDGKHVMKILKDAAADVEGVETLEPLNKCIPEIEKFNVKIDLGPWENEKKLLGAVGDNFKIYAQKFNSVSFDLSATEKFIIDFSDDITATERMKMVKGEAIKKVLEEVNALKTSLSPLSIKEVSEWAAKTQIENLIPTAKTSLESPETASALQCLQNKQMFDGIKGFIADRDTLSDLKSLTPTNKYLASLDTAANSLKGSIAKWEKLVSSYKNRRARATDKPTRIENGLEITRDLASALKVYFDLASAHSSEGEIRALLAAENTIDNAIKKLKDPEQKSRMTKLWSGETKTTLRNLPSFVDNLNKKITSIPTKLEKYSEVLNNTNFDGLGDVDMKELMDELQLMNLPEPNQNVMGKLRNLDLEFANAKSKINPGLKSFLLSLPFFSSFSSIDKNGSSNDGSKSTDGIPGGIIIIAFGVVLFICLIITLILFFVNYHQLKNEENRKKEAFKKTFCCGKKKETKAGETDNPDRSTVTTDSTDNQPKVFRTADGGYYVKPPPEKDSFSTKTAISKDFKKPEETTEADEVNKDKEVKDDLPKEFKKQVELMNSLIDQQIKNNEIFAAEPTGFKNIKFKKYTPADIEESCSIKPEEAVGESNNRIVFNAPSHYLVGRKLDTFEEDDVPDVNETEEQLKTMGAISEKNGKQKEEDVEMKSAKAPTVESKENLKQLRSLSEKFKPAVITEVTQEDYVNSRKGAGHDRKTTGETISDRWNFSAIKVLQKVGENLPKDMKEDKKDQNQDFSSEYFKYPISKDDKTPNYYAFRAGCMSKTMIQFPGYPKTTKNAEVHAPVPLNYARKMVSEATKKFRKEPAVWKINRRNTRVVGDIHGDYVEMARQIELGVADGASTFLFTGDIVDRGLRSIDCVLHMCALKITHGLRFIFLRGNHEMAALNFSGGFYDECIRIYGAKGGKQFWIDCNNMFVEMPLVCILNKKIWCAHGGISPLMVEGEKVFGEIKKKPLTDRQWTLHIDILWSDPVETYPFTQNINILFPRSKRDKKAEDISNFTALGLVMVLDACKLEGCIRGHEVVKHGVRLSSANKCITSYGANNHCKQGNSACQTIVHDNMTIDFIQIVSDDSPAKSDDDQKTTKAPLTKKSKSKNEKDQKKGR